MVEMQGIWIHTIKGYEEYKDYKIYPDGKVISFKLDKNGVQLKGNKDSKGYSYIDLRSKNGNRKCAKTHRLVGLAFIPNPHNKPQINHIDCNKLNNDVSNLEWVTNQENHDHKMANGLNIIPQDANEARKRGDNPQCKKVRQLTLQGEEVNIFPTIASAGRSLGKGYTVISKVCNGIRTTAYGYKWEFVNQ